MKAFLARVPKTFKNSNGKIYQLIEDMGRKAVVFDPAKDEFISCLNLERDKKEKTFSWTLGHYFQSKQDALADMYAR